MKLGQSSMGLDYPALLGLFVEPHLPHHDRCLQMGGDGFISIDIVSGRRATGAGSRQATKHVSSYSMYPDIVSGILQQTSSPPARYTLFIQRASLVHRGVLLRRQRDGLAKLSFVVHSQEHIEPLQADAHCCPVPICNNFQTHTKNPFINRILRC